MPLLWQKRAVADLYRVRDYIRRENLGAAERIGTIIEAASLNLLRHPEIGRAGEVHGARELVIAGTPYIIIYRVVNDDVQILRILHGKQKWSEA